MTELIPEGRFRDHAANERTLLAWIRTGVALMGFAIARFGLFLREIAQAGQVHVSGASHRRSHVGRDSRDVTCDSSLGALPDKRRADVGR
jgi:uncharacterized membrane protein YidH (DUF202 family)